MKGHVALIAVLLAPGAAAQTVELRLREDSTRVPVVGAIVRLLRENSPVAQGLSDELGRILLRAPGPGTYRLRIDRIGFAGELSDPLTLRAGQRLQTEILLVSTRVLLPTLEVRAESRCEDEGAGGPLGAALWDEVGKALTAQVLTLRQRPIPLHVTWFDREVDRTGRIEREWVTGSTVTHGQPFGALPPADLTMRGFAYDSSGYTLFAAPDAALLLSDEFVSTHCFRAVLGPDQLVGLEFEPTRDRRVVDVKGTLWVDRNTSELRFLEYSYTRLRAELSRADLGGRLEFQRLASGAWIISYWHIRMPHMGLRSARTRLTSLTGYLDQGGRAEVSATIGGGAARAIVTGNVFDSTTASPLAGAVVSVQGQEDSVLTDSAGAFGLAVVAAGDQMVVARHYKLGLIPDVSIRAALLSLGDTIRIDFAVPPVSAFVNAFCGPSGGRSGVVGIAWRADGTPAEDLTIRVTWRTSTGIKEERSRTGPRGVYALCDLPADTALPVRLLDRVQAIAEHEMSLEPGEFRWVELRP